MDRRSFVATFVAIGAVLGIAPRAAAQSADVAERVPDRASAAQFDVFDVTWPERVARHLSERFGTSRRVNLHYEQAIGMTLVATARDMYRIYCRRVPEYAERRRESHPAEAGSVLDDGRGVMDAITFVGGPLDGQDLSAAELEARGAVLLVPMGLGSYAQYRVDKDGAVHHQLATSAVDVSGIVAVVATPIDERPRDAIEIVAAPKVPVGELRVHDPRTGRRLGTIREWCEEARR